ncbi:MAG: IS1634 family transposase, partial [Spirosomaceae bacterium]|nr:IS1634 family transposase [Spirosomataceae bacterium]
MQIVQGHSKDHRPDLSQVGLAMITQGTDSIPLLMQTLSGNTAESTVFQQVVEDFAAQLKTDFDIEYLIADSKLYTQNTLKALDEAGLSWISRVPHTIKEVSVLMNNVALLPFTSIGQTGYRYHEFGSTYGGQNQRWLLLHSPSLQHPQELTY